MREYDEITLKIAERIFEKGDVILEQRKKRSTMIKRLTFSVSGMCAAAIAGVFVLHNDDIKNAVHHEDIPVITETSAVTSAEKTAVTTALETTSAGTSITKKTTTVSTAVTTETKTTVTEKASAVTETTSVSTFSATDERTAETESSAHTTEKSHTTVTETPSVHTTEASHTTVTSTTQTTLTVTETSTVSTTVISPITTTSHTDNSLSTTATTGEDVCIITSNAGTISRTDFRKYNYLIKRLNEDTDFKDKFILMDDYNTSHYVKLKSTDDMSAEEIIKMQDYTSFFDRTVFTYSGVYSEGITKDMPFEDLEQYYYDKNTETVYSTKMLIYFVTLERLHGDNRAYVIKLPQSDKYYLYTITGAAARDLYWK